MKRGFYGGRTLGLAMESWNKHLYVYDWSSLSSLTFLMTFPFRPFFYFIFPSCSLLLGSSKHS